MTVEIAKFKAIDLDNMRRHTGRIDVAKKHWEEIERTQKHSFTVRIENRILACGGIVEYWPGRGEAWAVVDKFCGNDFLIFDRIVRRFLKMAPYRRIEATVPKDFEQGHRWAKMLGFKVEAPTLEGYGFNGEDFSLYAKVKHV